MFRHHAHICLPTVSGLQRRDAARWRICIEKGIRIVRSTGFQVCAASLLRFASQWLFTFLYCASDLVDGRGYGAALRRILSSHSRVRRRNAKRVDHVRAGAIFQGCVTSVLQSLPSLEGFFNGAC